MSLKLCQNFFVEKFFGGFRRQRMKRVVEKHADAFLASAEAKGAGKLDLVFQIVLGNLFLKQLNYLPRALDMAGTSDTNSDFHGSVIPFLCCNVLHKAVTLLFHIIQL